MTRVTGRGMNFLGQDTEAVRGCATALTRGQTAITQVVSDHPLERQLLNGKCYQSSAQLFLFRAGGAGVLAAMVSSDVFAHEVQNATFGPEVRIVAPGGKQLITLEG